MNELAVFTLDSLQYALPHTVIDRIIRAVEITELPNSPPHLLGIINIHGRVIPVLNIRHCFGLPECELDVQHYLIICHFHHRLVGFVVDSAQGLIRCTSSEMSDADDIVPDMKYIDKVIKTASHFILVIHPEKLLTTQEKASLENVLSETE